MLNDHKLTDEELDIVTGGRILNATGLPSCDPNNPWEIVDNKTGKTLYRYNCKEAAIIDAVKKYGGWDYNDVKDITTAEVTALRTANGIPL